MTNVEAMTCALFFKRSIVVVMSGAVVGLVAMVVSAKAQSGRTANNYTVRTLPLPDNGTGDVSMDYMAFDPATNRLWVPDANAGAVDVVDVATGNVRQIRNLPIFHKVRDRGGPRVLGPFGALAMASCISGIAPIRLSVRLMRVHSRRGADVRTSTVAMPLRGRTVSPMLHPQRKCG